MGNTATTRNGGDIYQYRAAFHLSPRWPVLQERLKKARSYKNVKGAGNFDALVRKLSAAADSLDEIRLEELRPLLSSEEMAGLAFRLRAALLTLCEEMKKMTFYDCKKLESEF